MTTPTFTVGQRVRVRRRHIGRQYYAAGQTGAVLEYERVRDRNNSGGWYLIDTLPVPMWYAPEQLEAVR
jgi:hypothetical protein